MANHYPYVFLCINLIMYEWFDKSYLENMNQTDEIMCDSLANMSNEL